MKTAKEVQEWAEKHKISEIFTDTFEKWFNSKEPKYIDIPEGVKFQKYNTGELGIMFNEYKYILGYDYRLKAYSILPYIKELSNFIDCKVIECRYEDLKVGDFFVCCNKELDRMDIDNCFMYLRNDIAMYISNETDIKTTSISLYRYDIIYKVVEK